MYRAPELLRIQESFLSKDQPHGTQKGDSYSFGIILYELHSRHGPFGDIDLSAAEILNKIISCANPHAPFRYVIRNTLKPLRLRYRSMGITNTVIRYFNILLHFIQFQCFVAVTLIYCPDKNNLFSAFSRVNDTNTTLIIKFLKK